MFSPDSKVTVCDCNEVHWHGPCRSAARYLEVQAANKDKAELNPQSRTNLSTLRKFQKDQKPMWQKKVLSLVVTEPGKNRTNADRDKASQLIQSMTTYTEAQTLRDVAMLDQEEFIQHHKNNRGWSQAKCEQEKAPWECAGPPAAETRCHTHHKC